MDKHYYQTIKLSRIDFFRIFFFLMFAVPGISPLLFCIFLSRGIGVDGIVTSFIFSFPGIIILLWSSNLFIDKSGRNITLSKGIPFITYKKHFFIDDSSKIVFYETTRRGVTKYMLSLVSDNNKVSTSVIDISMGYGVIRQLVKIFDLPFEIKISGKNLNISKEKLESSYLERLKKDDCDYPDTEEFLGIFDFKRDVDTFKMGSSPLGKDSGKGYDPFGLVLFMIFIAPFILTAIFSEKYRITFLIITIAILGCFFFLLIFRTGLHLIINADRLEFRYKNSVADSVSIDDIDDIVFQGRLMMVFHNGGKVIDMKFNIDITYIPKIEKLLKAEIKRLCINQKNNVRYENGKIIKS